jgi:DNA gyrase/topoisomerase IV subunit B
VEDKEGRDSQTPRGTLVRFVPDPDIFKNYVWNDEYIERRLRYYTYLNAGLGLVFNGKKFKSKLGLVDLLHEEMGEEPSLYELAHYRDKRIEFAFTHVNSYGEHHYSFVNGQFTNDGGTHESAFREGVLKGLNAYAGKNFAGEVQKKLSIHAG